MIGQIAAHLALNAREVAADLATAQRNQISVSRKRHARKKRTRRSVAKAVK
jgi:hypothetical protein